MWRWPVQWKVASPVQWKVASPVQWKVASPVQWKVACAVPMHFIHNDTLSPLSLCNRLWSFPITKQQCKIFKEVPDVTYFTSCFLFLCVVPTESGTWSKLETHGQAPRPRDKVASAAIGDKIYIFGGFGPQGTEVDVSSKYFVEATPNLLLGQWIRLPLVFLFWN